jgi:hypothetical protein
VYGTALVVRNAQLTSDSDGMLSMRIELPGELDHHLAMRAFDGDAVSIYSNDIFIPALAVSAASADREALLLGSAFARGALGGAEPAADAGEGASVDGATAVAIVGAGEEASRVVDGADLRFELDSSAAQALDLSVTTPYGNDVHRTRASADGCTYAGLEASAEAVNCVAPALGPYMLRVGNRSGAELPASLRVLARGVEHSRYELRVPAGGEEVVIYENALAPAGCSVVSVGRQPLDQLGTRTYLGFEGGLYPEGASDPPPDHAGEGRAHAARVLPVDPVGEVSDAGAIVVLALGSENAGRQFEALTNLAVVDPSLAKDIVWVNGAGNDTGADAPDADRVRDEWLAPTGLSEAQVQVIWLAPVSASPETGLPDPDADAFALLAQLGDRVRELHARYPNLRLVLLSSTVYGGYATGSLPAEPYAYESAFAVKWLVEGQIRQNAGLGIDPVAGDLAPDVAPWLGWGPYLWADGLEAREDGLDWTCGDFVADGTHLSSSGEEKAAGLLLDSSGIPRSPRPGPVPDPDAGPRASDGSQR